MTTASELKRAECLLMRWPCSKRIQIKVRELRAKESRERETQARKLRGEIIRRIKHADISLLSTLVHVLVCP